MPRSAHADDRLIDAKGLFELPESLGRFFLQTLGYLVVRQPLERL